MINSNFGFTPLREVWLGDCYPSAFYDHLPNEIADPFRQITEWTKQDTGRLQAFLESRGIVVRRPVFGTIEHYVDETGRLLKPPVTPRDDYLVLGQTLYSLHNQLAVDPWQHWIDHYSRAGYHTRLPKDSAINCLSPPSLVRIGRDLYIDTDSHQHIWGMLCEWIVEASRDYRINIASTNGHSDGVFCPVAMNTLVTSHYKTNYSSTFPGWDVFHVPKELHNFTHAKNWLTHDASIEKNHCFADHILHMAQDWVGNFSETVYEVNMLVLDQENVVVMKDYPPLTGWLAERDIDVHVFDLRTRSFWDGGWHCFTLDIQRDDSVMDLFPERGPNGVYWRFDPGDNYLKGS